MIENKGGIERLTKGVSQQGTNYGKIIMDNLSKIYIQLPDHLEKHLGTKRKGNRFYFRAFGEECCLGPDMIDLSGNPAVEPRGLLISLYAIHANPDPIQLEPFKSFKDLPGSMPYQGAFHANSERVLVPRVVKIREEQRAIKEVFNGQDGLKDSAADFSFILFPLPKIALYYLFYLPDEEFPASATCLFSANALSFMPLDGLADVAEYTSKGIVQLVSK
ncbi:MAG: DUF3786 domain-containing protein [Desulfobacteraceae bacterium]|nr:DUF3786 domain-containing protein [Desulfobacteraceae bacterium]